MEKISLNSSPSSLLSAKIGDVFELDGRDYILEGKHLVYLTLLDTSSSQWYKEKEDKYVWAHLGNKAGTALMTREEMCDIIQSGSYFIE